MTTTLLLALSLPQTLLVGIRFFEALYGLCVARCRDHLCGHLSHRTILKHCADCVCLGAEGAIADVCQRESDRFLGL